ncbi:ABC transporter ATP-binding protein [Zhenpiania hominis]|uniref:ABC transporter ATP-binding protein n=1 Tax=Zhenpiania hominis TaxID=2763644 RepID=A0A923NMJ8_9FIRM|nr:ABC transporter ATP-binding protein [Zhenpiania hominis]MBC6679744.1 ABC transporter ATP-binding protein [Zhenpiania hominis]
MNKVIDAKGICKEFIIGKSREQVLKQISFQVRQGEFLSVMGPSGCGKSTLLYILGGLDLPTGGEVYSFGRSYKDMSEKEKSKMRRTKIGFVFQFYNLVPNLNVEDNILLPILLDGKKIKDYENPLSEILEITGLTERRKFKPRELSGGQQQRVAIARALLFGPELILADEPIGNLDSKSGIEIMELFKKINREMGKTIIQVTHSEEAALYGTRLIRMKDGVIKEDKRIEQK